MYDVAKKAREAMKAKAKGLADRPVEKVDSSDWTPPPLIKAEAKTGMRPVSRRAFKKGGKVVGDAAKVRADRKPRKAGGATEQPLVDRYVNRDLKKANEYRDGEKHIGGFKHGGRSKKQDGGPTTDPRLGIVKNKALEFGQNVVTPGLKKGGRVHRDDGGKVKKPINWAQAEEGYRDVPRTGENPYATGTSAEAEEQLENLAKTGSLRGRPTSSPDYPERKSGGRAEKWIKGAIKHPGALHKSLHVKEGEKIPAKKLEKAAHSDNPKLAKRANLAMTLKKMHKAEGGGAGDGKRTDKPENVYRPEYNEMAVDKAIRTSREPISKKEGKAIKGLLGGWQQRVKDYGRKEGGKAGHPDIAEDKALIKKMVKEKSLKGHKHGGEVHGDDCSCKRCMGGRTKKYQGGGVFSGEGYPHKIPGVVAGGRDARATGGKAKGKRGKTDIKIYIGSHQHAADQDPSAMMAAMGQAPMGQPAMPPMPPMAGGMPAGAPPMGGAPMMPQGMPPMGRKSGGRVAKQVGGAMGPRFQNWQQMMANHPQWQNFMQNLRNRGQVTSPTGVPASVKMPTVAAATQPMASAVAPAVMPTANVPGGLGTAPASTQSLANAGAQLVAAQQAGMQPMARKSGGRISKVAKSYQDMEAGAGSGEGRLQKTDIAKRSMHKAGGKVYRSYKDMDAGAGSGVGRLEKTEIESRKR